MKSVKGWVVIDPNGEAVMKTLSLTTKKLSTWAFITTKQVRGIYQDWSSYWYKRGYRCVRVTLRED